MNAPVAVPKGQIIQIPNFRIPEQGAQALPFTADFSTGAAFDGSFQSAFDSGVFDIAQSVYIDNGINPSPMTLIFPGVGSDGQYVIAPPFSQGYYQISPASQEPRFTVESAGGVKVRLIFYNVPTAPIIWNTQTAGGGIITGTFTDRSGFIAAAGTSQPLAPANAARKRIVIENPSTAAGQGGIAAAESLYINFGAAAGVDNGTSIELTPGGSFDSAAGPVSTQEIFVNAPTIDHVYIAKEM